MLIGIASQQIPGLPVEGHPGEAAWVVEIFLRQGFDLLKEGLKHLPGFIQHFFQRTIFISQIR